MILPTDPTVAAWPNYRSESAPLMTIERVDGSTVSGPAYPHHHAGRLSGAWLMMDSPTSGWWTLPACTVRAARPFEPTA